MEAFDVVHSPLEGPTCLIEAGAGTGKTYALTGLFLRLILEQGIAPEKILTVTFTTAATGELRERLRRQLLAARRILVGGPGEADATLVALVHKARLEAESLKRIDEALRDFDRIPILTIHGFCQRLLLEMAFETGSGFGDELVPQAAPFIQEVAEDYWRQTFENTDPECVAYALQAWQGPEALSAFYDRFGMADLQILAPDAVSIDFTEYRDLYQALRDCWLRERTRIQALLQVGGFKANVYGPTDSISRHTKLTAWSLALDSWLHTDGPCFPPPDCLAYFSRRKIVASLRKGMPEPQHQVFALCDRLGEAAEVLKAALGRWQGAFLKTFIHFADQTLQRRKARQSILFFDDLLQRVARVLQNAGAPELMRSVRQRFQVALVDEFQDTDPVQYRIFHCLFGAPPHCLYMIGDPKQAIYGFRGADIFAYLKAARISRSRFTLTANWRSFPRLIQAVNALFTAHPRSFLIPEIVFRPAAAAIAQPPDPPEGKPPLCLWWLDRSKNTAGVSARRKDDIIDQIEDAVVAEIVKLIDSGDRRQSMATAPSDIAVLVRTNAQARGVKAKLMAARVPAIIYNAGEVYQTPEARTLELVLQAIADPGDERKMRAALTTDLLGLSGEELDFEENPPDWWTDLLERFDAYRRTWHEHGFTRMFRNLLAGEGVAARLLRWVDGERRLTNLLHLGELIHQTAVQQRAGVAALLNWLADQRRANLGHRDEQQQRLESDAQGVNLLTVHKCKGLEFPVVFYPFGWESRSLADWPLVFHDRGADMQRTLDLRLPADAIHRAWARDERLAEDLRLLYVALTRAKRNCYLVWGNLPSSATSALAYLLHYRSAPNGNPPEAGVAADLERLMLSLHTEDLRRDLQDLAGRAGGSIAILDLPPADKRRERVPADPLPDLRPRAAQRRYETRWQVASFSSLVQLGTAEREIADPSFENLDISAPVDPPLAKRIAARLPEGRAAFPRGARSGLFLHSFLEQIDFTRSGVAQMQTPLTAAMRDFGVDEVWAQPLAEWLSRVLHSALSPDDEGLFLAQLPPKACLREMEFYFPLKPFAADQLRPVLAAAPAFRSSEALGQALKRLEFSISGGFLKGYVDLVFRYRQRYFIVDWKSNFLGESYADYEGRRLQEVVARENYFLQYYLYSLALNRYLSSSLPSYDYQKQFGGVYYLFLRGMDPEHPECGIYYDRPNREVLVALDHAMIEECPQDEAAAGSAV